MSEGRDEVQAGLQAAVELLGGQPREGQQRMAGAVANALAGGESLLVQAGTGTGKSLGYLIPAARHAVEAGDPVVIATATLALQRQVMLQDIPTAQAAIGGLLPRRPTAALLKGRGNYLCRLRLADGDQGADADEQLFDTRGALEKQAALVREWAEGTESGDRDDLPEPVDGRVWQAFSVSGRECVGRQKCPYGEDCFAEAARDAAREADLVVTNHTLLALHVQSDGGTLPEFGALIVDEAHELVGRTTQAATETLSVGGLSEAIRRCGRQVDDSVRSALESARDDYESALLAMSAEPGRRLEELPQEVVRALAVLRDAHHAAATALAGPGDEDIAARQRAIASVTEIHDLAGRLLAGSGADVLWFTEHPTPGISAAPLSVARSLGEAFAQCAVVGTSATLSLGGTFEPLARQWGWQGEGAEVGATDAAGARWRWLDVGSPFDYGKQAIIYTPTDLPPPGREAIADEVLARVGALVRAAGGRTLVLASSWRSVDALAEYLADMDLVDVPLLVQQRGSPVGPLVARFRDEQRSVLVGTMSLWQGVDVPGPACSAVVIERIPFPRPDDPVMAARARAAEQAGRSGFGTVQLPHAALLLAQGAGRLIRRSSDRGVVAILDSRLATRSYGNFLLRTLPPMWRTADTQAVLAALQRLAAAAEEV